MNRFTQTPGQNKKVGPNLNLKIKYGCDLNSFFVLLWEA